MSITYPLTAPTSPAIRTLDLEFAPAIATTESPFTTQVTTYEHEGLVWRASVTLPPLRNTDGARIWQGFLVALNGRVGTFTMSPPQSATPRGTQAVDIAVRTATSRRAKTLPVKGLTVGATLLRGDLISIADRLYMLAAAVTGDGSGEATLTLSHGLRADVSVDETVKVLAPVGTWRLSDNAVVRSIQLGGVSTISFGVEEAI